jgi:hypothetical protein
LTIIAKVEGEVKETKGGETKRGGMATSGAVWSDGPMVAERGVNIHA